MVECNQEQVQGQIDYRSKDAKNNGLVDIRGNSLAAAIEDHIEWLRGDHFSA